MSAHQMASLQDALATPLVADQLELSLARHGFVDSGVLVNHAEATAVDFPHGTLEHCRRHGIELQAWGALAQGRFSGRPRGPEDESAARAVAGLAAAHDVAPEAIVLAWLMRHPARVSPVVGTTDRQRIRACAEAPRIAEQMSRQEWYDLYLAARGRPLP